jgi:hypothetical protein
LHDWRASWACFRGSSHTLEYFGNNLQNDMLMFGSLYLFFVIISLKLVLVWYHVAYIVDYCLFLWVSTQVARKCTKICSAWPLIIHLVIPHERKNIPQYYLFTIFSMVDTRKLARDYEFKSKFSPTEYLQTYLFSSYEIQSFH